MKTKEQLKQAHKRIEITVGEVIENQKQNTKSISVYDTSVDKVLALVKKALSLN